MTGLLVHNIVESTLVQPFVSKIFWFLTAIAATRWMPGPVTARAPVRSRVPRRAALQRPTAAESRV
jgi:hypothetical protein